MIHNDPIDKQQRLVSALTGGCVQWTVAHRDALRALDEGRTLHSIPPHIWKDLKIFLEVLGEKLKTEQSVPKT